jgi:PST family polysaccharide transporter
MTAPTSASPGMQPRELERSATRGLAYAGARFVLERGMVFVATLVLARLLTPDEFGVVAFSLAVMYYFDAVTDLGLGAALVYRSDAREERIASTAFWIGFVGATGMALLLWCLAPLFASVGPGQETVWLLRVLSLQFPLSALGKVHEYRIRASLDFKKLVRPFAVSTFMKGAVAVVAAALGAGVWSLVIGQLVGTLIRSIALWRVEPWRPRVMFSRAATPSLLKFGTGIVAVELLGQIAKSFDYLVVGAKIGATALGFYFLAFRLPELVVLGMFQVANEVLFPFYARLRETSANGSSEELRAGYVRTVQLSAAIALPAGLGMAALAVPLVLVLYGPEWRPSAAPLAFVAIWAALASLATLPGVVFKATGRSWLLTATGVLQIAVLLPAIWIAADYGIAAVAAAQVIEKIVSLSILGVFVGRVLHIPWHTTFTASAPLLLPSIVMAGLVFLLGVLLGPLLALVFAIPLGVGVYALLLRVFAPDLFQILVAPMLRASLSGIRPAATEAPR